MPSTAKNLLQSCVRHGSWTADDSVEKGMGMVSSENGATLSCTVVTTAMHPVVGGYSLEDGNGGSFVVALDGMPCGTFFNSGQGAKVMTIHGTTRTTAGFRCAASAGTHTVAFSVTSASSSVNRVALEWVGSPPDDTTASGYPTVIAGGVLHPALPGADISATLTASQFDEVSATFSAITQKLVMQGQADGLRLSFFDSRAVLGSNPAFFHDNIHPNQAGYNKLAASFLVAAGVLH